MADNVTEMLMTEAVGNRIADLLERTSELNNAGYRNSFFRGRCLGSEVTDEQWEAIKSGSFQGLFLGDYWKINDVKWRIAAFDYFLRKGDTENTTHHVVIVPDTNLLAANGSTTHYMNTTNVTTGGYKGSGFHSGTLTASPRFS